MLVIAHFRFGGLGSALASSNGDGLATVSSSLGTRRGRPKKRIAYTQNPGNAGVGVSD